MDTIQLFFNENNLIEIHLICYIILDAVPVAYPLLRTVGRALALDDYAQHINVLSLLHPHLIYMDFPVCRLATRSSTAICVLR